VLQSVSLSYYFNDWCMHINEALSKVLFNLLVYAINGLLKISESKNHGLCSWVCAVDAYLLQIFNK
jgi:hypothetical protein